MPRKKDPDFLNRLVEAGLRVFSRKGINQARMAEVAEELGVSQGTLYNYVASKEALFYLLILSRPDDGPIELPTELPIEAPTQEVLEARLEERIRDDFALPILDAALAKEAASDPERELEEIVLELWATTARTRGPATALERSAIDRPDLFGLFLDFRRDLFGRYERYLVSRDQSGQLTSMHSHRVAARFLIETVTFFARHRYLDPDRSLLPDDDTVEIATVDLVLHGLIGPARRRQGGPS